LRLIWNEFKSYRSLITAIFFGLLLISQFGNFVSFLALNVDHQSVISARDDDSGWGIIKAVRTRWWKDNGWAHYGPGYFRPAHSLQYYLGSTASLANERDHEVWERTAHFSILLISLMSVYAFMLLISSLLTESWAARFSLTALFVALGLSNLTWAEFLLRAHPDHLFALVCALAFWATARWQQKPEDQKFFVGSALLWGLATSVKLSVVLLSPALLLLFFPSFQRDNFKTCGKYIGYIFLGYFLIGFPQTIVLDRPVKFLLSQSQYSVAPDSSSMIEWLYSFVGQSWKILVAILTLTIFMPGPSKFLRLSKLSWLRLTILVAFPLVVMFFQKTLVSTLHYAIPFVVMLFMLVAFSWARVRRFEFRGAVFLPLIVMVTTVGTTPTAMTTNLHMLLECRQENRAMYEHMVKWGEEGKKIWVDPYVPYDTRLSRSQQDVSWSKSWREWNEKRFDIIVLNRKFMERFIGSGGVTDYAKVDVPEYEIVREFYLSFKGDAIVGPDGSAFRKTVSNKCGQEVWELTK
jgi:hypothetical protein